MAICFSNADRLRVPPPRIGFTRVEVVTVLGITFNNTLTLTLMSWKWWLRQLHLITHWRRLKPTAYSMLRRYAGDISSSAALCQPGMEWVQVWRKLMLQSVLNKAARYGFCQAILEKLTNYMVVHKKTLPFLPCDAMHKRGYCRHAMSVCLSVRLSVTFVSCAKTNKDIFEIFPLSGSQTILVFPYQTGWRYSDENPLTGSSNARGYEKMTIFDQYLAVSQKRL